MTFNPFAALDHLLSNKSFELLKQKHHPTTPYTWYDPDEGVNVQDIGYTHLSHEEEESIQSIIPSDFKAQLEAVIENLKNEIDARTFSLDSDKERREFCKYLSRRVDITINRWKDIPSSQKHPNSFILLDGLREHLKTLSSIWDSGNEHSDNHQQTTTVYELHEGFKLTNLHIKAERLDVRQAALLFHYLREAKVFINYSDKSLAQVAHLLTGHSEKNLRTEQGLGLIDEIIKDGLKLRNFNHIDNYNLLTIKHLLEEIIDFVNTAIEGNKNRKKK